MGITNGNKKVMDRQVFAIDQVIFREGKPGNAAYVVQEGQVEVYKTLNGEEEVILGTIEAGGLFGELALVDNKPRMASARAKERTVLIAINRQTFEKKMGNTDRFVRAILRILLGNYRTVVRRAALAEAKLKEHGIELDG
jgi:CRP-like cAMP-binding protein